MMNKQIQRHLKSFWYNHCRNSKHWASFETFLNEVGLPPKQNMRLTRKCIKKGFTPGNLMWAKSENRSSRYLVNTIGGHTASLRAACEQDQMRYQNVYGLIKNYGLEDHPQGVYNFSKLSKDARRAIRRQAYANAIKNFSLT